jgi:hypothetical protein
LRKILLNYKTGSRLGEDLHLKKIENLQLQVF